MPSRIFLHGVTGSGKTTLAAHISDRTGLPWYSVDELTWEPGWVEVPADEQRRRITAICAGDRWILDTAYSAWIDIPMASVDLIVALDYPRRVSLTRLVRRTVRRLVTRELACNGNQESLRNMLGNDSIIRWHFRSFARKHARIAEWEQTGRPMVRLRSPRETAAWLRTLAPE